MPTAKTSSAKRTRGRPAARAVRRVNSHTRGYVVQNDRTTHVLVPIREYEELVKSEMLRQSAAKLNAPDSEWVDFDDYKLQLAASRIAAARKARNMTQVALAKKLGIPQSQISRIERNPDQTTVRTLKRIAHALGVPVSKLL